MSQTESKGAAIVVVPVFVEVHELSPGLFAATSPSLKGVYAAAKTADAALAEFVRGAEVIAEAGAFWMVTGGAKGMSATDDVIAERARQKSVEGWTPEHDDMNSDGELARAAAVYAMTGSARWLGDRARREKADLAKAPHGWPWALESFKPKSPRADLVRAAALIVAEIERLDRAAVTKPAAASHEV